MKFKRLTSDQYLKIVGDKLPNKMYNILMSADDISLKLGEPHRYFENDFPDDAVKCDVCWGIENAHKDVILVWNYKNGHFVGEDLPEDMSTTFSAYYSNEDFFQEFKKDMGFE